MLTYGLDGEGCLGISGPPEAGALIYLPGDSGASSSL